MKYILAFVAPDLLHRVKDSLISHHVHGLSISEARGFGRKWTRPIPNIASSLAPR
jgi:nitrogen regulatory protein PII